VIRLGLAMQLPLESLDELLLASRFAHAHFVHGERSGLTFQGLCRTVLTSFLAKKPDHVGFGRSKLRSSSSCAKAKRRSAIDAASPAARLAYLALD